MGKVELVKWPPAQSSPTVRRSCVHRTFMQSANGDSSANGESLENQRSSEYKNGSENTYLS